VREGDIKGADRAFQALADTAHSRHISQVEADTYRQMAICHPMPSVPCSSSTKPMQRCWSIGTQPKQPSIGSGADSPHTRRTCRTGRRQEGRTGEPEPLDKWHRPPATLIEAAYHGAAAAVFYSDGNYDPGYEHLEEDTDNLSP